MGFEGLGRGAVCTVEEGNGGEQQEEEMCAEEVEKRSGGIVAEKRVVEKRCWFDVCTFVLLGTA
jgi:hypothetical protein